MHIETISGYDRPQGGSRYADKQPGRKKEMSKRQAAGRRRRRNNRMMSLLLVVLIAAAVCLIAVWGITSYRATQTDKTNEELEKIQGDLTGGIYDAVVDHCLAIGADGGGGTACGDWIHKKYLISFLAGKTITG